MNEFEFSEKEIKEFIESDVPSYQKNIVLQALVDGEHEVDFYDEIGRKLTGEGKTNPMMRSTGPAIDKTSFLDKLKLEVYIFICTEDKKYGTERNLLGKNFKEIVTILSTAIAATFSFGTGVIVGAITTILISVAKVNKNAWCELQKEQLKSP